MRERGRAGRDFYRACRDAIVNAADGAEHDDRAVFGIRHHGPGSARRCWRALDASGRTSVLIEGPPEADALVAWVAAEGMVPPVALLAYAADEPRSPRSGRSRCSRPEWQAMRWAVGRRTGAVLRPAGRAGTRSGRVGGATLPTTAEHRGRGPRRPGRASIRSARWPRPPGTTTPSAGGRTWSSSGATAAAPFEAITEAMAELRAATGPRRPPARAARGVHAADDAAGMQARVRADRGGVRRLARPGADRAVATGHRRRARCCTGCRSARSR